MLHKGMLCRMASIVGGSGWIVVCTIVWLKFRPKLLKIGELCFGSYGMDLLVCSQWESDKIEGWNGLLFLARISSLRIHTWYVSEFCLIGNNDCCYKLCKNQIDLKKHFNTNFWKKRYVLDEKIGAKVKKDSFTIWLQQNLTKLAAPKCNNI